MNDEMDFEIFTSSTNHIYIAPICGATEALDDSQSGGIKQKRFHMFLKNRV